MAFPRSRPVLVSILVGSTLALGACSGAGSSSLVRVPHLVGTQEKAAESALGHLGLKAKVVIQRHSTLTPPPVQSVIAQSPGAGRSVHRGGTVTLVVYL
ncbi:MAG: PASTA domain-containing protein [Streptosporangiaceae bacterium]